MHIYVHMCTYLCTYVKCMQPPVFIKYCNIYKIIFIIFMKYCIDFIYHVQEDASSPKVAGDRFSPLHVCSSGLSILSDVAINNHMYVSGI